jgi:cytochrome c553
MRIWLLWLVLITALSRTPAFAETRDLISRSYISACESCHGRYGNPEAHLIPRINAQKPHYIIMRLNQLSQAGDGRSAVAVAHANLPEKLKSEIALYFAALPATKRESRDASGVGAKIYHDGDTSRNIGRCSYCHGNDGEGDGVVPRLAGQHKAYLKIRLDLLSSLPLENGGAMHLAVHDVTPEEIDNIASYLAAQ